MSAGFQIAGSLVNSAPIVRRLMTGETMYQGQLVMGGQTGGLGGHVQVFDVPAQTYEDDFPLLGIVNGVVDDSRAYNSTYKGDSTTYTTTQATVKADGASEVLVSLIIPYNTLIKGPIYNATFGTALTLLTNTTASSGGVLVTHAGETLAVIPDDYGTVYCRSGANRGLYRVVTTGATGSQTVTVPFPNAIAVDDTFVAASVVLGVAHIDFPATVNCIDGNNAMTSYLSVYCHELNLEEAGKEYAVFSLTNIPHLHPA